MSDESAIQAEVEVLRERFSDTKALYREVCALLFFRFGITPTTNKLYQFVRKGSMSAPTEALAKFWEDLRAKSRVQLDHPDLPDELKAAAAETIAVLWRQASTRAREELAAGRLESQQAVDAAHQETQHARESARQATATADTLRGELAEAQQTAAQLQVELEGERRAHVATVARMQELQRQLDDLKERLERARSDFSAELGKAREAVESANTRSDAAQRRALLEIDQERQARARAEQALETLRAQLEVTERQAREAAVAHATETTRLAAEAHRQVQAAQAAQVALSDARRDLAALQQRLDAERERATDAIAQANALRAVLEHRDAKAPSKAKRAARSSPAST